MRKRIALLLLLTATAIGSRAQREGQEISILFAGDIMGHSTLIESGRQGDGSYDFDACFQYVREYISGADLAIANLEVTLAGKPYSSYPYFSSPDALAVAAKNAGFDILTTANNHCMDKGKAGLERTVWALDSMRIPHLGTYVDMAAHDRYHPLMVEKNGFKLALLCYTYGTNGISVSKPNVVNFIDTAMMRQDIARAKAQKADFIIAMVHWGIEYQTSNNAEQQKVARWLMNHGCDVIIGGHPHVVQNMTDDVNPNNERYPEIVVYSMGNLISNQRDVNTDGGIMIELNLRKENGKTWVRNCKYMPYWVDRSTVKGKRQYRIVPSTDAQNYPSVYHLNASAQNALKTFNKNLQKRMEDCIGDGKGHEGGRFEGFAERKFYQKGKELL